jgi:pyruvate formate lyase activating enzyme
MDNLTDKEGLIFKIKRFSVHDGPGIRTTVFLKGCPLNCIWCHSPEGISPGISIWHNSSSCIACGQCILACPVNALELIPGKENNVVINRELCEISGSCVSICPANAMRFTGFLSTVADIIDEIMKDMVYYDASGGGVTLTGGEPLFQPGFTAAILQACKAEHIHTAIETSLFSERNAIDLVLPHTDLFIADLKLFDPAVHLTYTGKSNSIIKENFKYIADTGKQIVVRIPMINSITDTEDNLDKLTDLVNNINNNISIERISYNPLAVNNYKKLGIPFLLEDE